MLKDKRGLSNEIMVVIVMAFALGVIILFSYLVMLVLPLISDTTQVFTGIIEDASVSSGNEALENATVVSFAPVSEGVQQLEWITFMLFVFMLITMLIMCFYVRTYPFLAFVWLLMVLVLVFISIFLTNAYNDIRQGELSDVYQSWENTDFYLQYLPHIVLVMGIIGGIIMFAMASRRPDEMEGYI